MHVVEVSHLTVLVNVAVLLQKIVLEHVMVMLLLTVLANVPVRQQKITVEHVTVIHRMIVLQTVMAFMKVKMVMAQLKMNAVCVKALALYMNVDVQI